MTNTTKEDKLTQIKERQSRIILTGSFLFLFLAIIWAIFDSKDKVNTTSIMFTVVIAVLLIVGIIMPEVVKLIDLKQRDINRNNK